MSLCDCGNEKSRTLEACDSCLWLDGYCAKETSVIDALRKLVTSSNVDEIAGVAGIEPRSVLRLMPGLLSSGRVVKKTQEDRTIYRLGEKRQ